MSSPERPNPVRQDLGYEIPFTPLTREVEEMLARNGIGTERVRRRVASHDDDVRRGIGSNDPELSQEAKDAANQKYKDASAQFERERLERMSPEDRRFYELRKVAKATKQ